MCFHSNCRVRKYLGLYVAENMEMHACGMEFRCGTCTSCSSSIFAAPSAVTTAAKAAAAVLGKRLPPPRQQPRHSPRSTAQHPSDNALNSPLSPSVQQPLSRHPPMLAGRPPSKDNAMQRLAKQAARSFSLSSHPAPCYPPLARIFTICPGYSRILIPRIFKDPDTWAPAGASAATQSCSRQAEAYARKCQTFAGEMRTCPRARSRGTMAGALPRVGPARVNGAAGASATCVEASFLRRSRTNLPFYCACFLTCQD